MPSVTRCLHQLDHASAVTGSTMVALVSDALDALEAAFVRPAERIVALEQVLHEVQDRMGAKGKPFAHLVVTLIDQRQSRLSQISKPQTI
jgi:hypothetical protein